ncbi:TolC family protein [Tepidicaulis sp.]|jgi:outer membrane protein TolC|uniref:TolC family protein n=1 Tax=Tepidicaulis sp. TaxID=1920809 RepID=UPI000EF87E10
MRPIFHWAGRLAALLLPLAAAPALSAEPAALGFEEAARLAADAPDPSLARLHARAGALEDLAVADAALPDPKLRAGFLNFPTDTFRDAQEPMTQYQIGLRQDFPPGDTLSFKGQERQAEAGIAQHEKGLLRRQIVFDVRRAWLDLFLAERAKHIAEENLGALRELAGAQTASFASGRSGGQDIFRAELEIALMEERLSALAQSQEKAKARLGRYIGAHAARPLPAGLPALGAPASPDILKEALAAHPAVKAEEAAIRREEAEIGIAEEAYKPAWGIEAGYGYRAGGQADFASIGVTLSIPLFTANRQDRRLSAAMKEREAARLGRAALLRDLARDLETALADWRQFEKRRALYENAVTGRARAAAQASVNAYANGTADFPEIVRDRVAVFEAELALLAVQVDQAKAWAAIAYLTGDNHE